MKRGMIFLIISLILILGIVLFQENIIGQTFLKSDIELLQSGTNVNWYDLDCSGGNPPKECLIYISEETACDAEWSKQCHIWADNNGDEINSCWTLPYTSKSLCCPIGEGNTGPGGIYNHSIYDKGNSCCDQNIPDEGIEGSHEGNDGKLLQIPFSTDKDGNGYHESDCCPGIGPFVEDENQDGRQDKVCCSNNDGTREIKNMDDGGCLNCCACLTYYEEKDQSKVCQEAQALSIKCRQKYGFPKCTDLSQNCEPYPDACAVALSVNPITNQEQYENADDPDSRYNNCINGEMGAIDNSNFDNIKSICDNLDVPAKRDCPFFALKTSDNDIPDSWCSPNYKAVLVSPSCQCETDFFKCCHESDKACIDSGVTC